ncbi:hypothetical protein [Natronorarus salvus]|uniref:hypothetical protein n=1 Tax=Natronorarus salvus TaxID=3117733 RepID=UPI002F2618DF
MSDEEGERTDGGRTYRPGIDDPYVREQQIDPGEREFDTRGWVLVATILLAFVVAPVAIYLLPHLVADNLSYLVALIVFPLLPAVLLGVVAVWATVRP